MSDTVLIALIAGLPGIIAALVSAYNTVLAKRNAANITRIEVNTNSISSRNEEIAKRLGIAEGRASEKQEQSSRDKPQ